MSNPVSQDNFVAYCAAVVVAGLVAIFLFTWSQLRTPGDVQPVMAYAKFGPYLVQTQKFEITTTIAVGTGMDSARWAKQQKKNLDVVFQMVLAKADPRLIAGKNGMQTMQDSLRDAANQYLHTNNIETVFLTNFIMRRRD
jgi:flagellar basal body-associated protein FliL